jgi:hypothetical protein
MKASVGGWHGKHCRAERARQGVRSERRIDGVDAVRKSKERKNVAARQDKHAAITPHCERRTR